MFDRVEAYYRRARAYLHKEIWQVRPKHLPLLHGSAVRLLRVLLIAGQGFRSNRCRLHASALTFVTLLAIVPVLAVMFAIARGFSSEEHLESTISRIVEALASDVKIQQWLTENAGYIIDKAKNADPATLGAVGVALFFYTLVKMLGTIESSFNSIWGVTRSRAFLRKLADYISTIVVMSALFAVPALATGSLTGSSTVLQWLQEHNLSSMRLVFFLAPWVGFALLNLFIPNTTVRWWPAIIGGFIGATLWNLSLVFFLKAGIGVATRNAVYGTFASVPFALVWLQLNWLIVLMSAQLTYAFQNERAYAREGSWIEATHASRETIALAIMAPVAQHFRDGKPPWTPDGLAEFLDAPLKLVNELIEVLQQKHILIAGTTGENTAFIPARSLEAIGVSQIVDAVAGYDREQRAVETAGRRVLELRQRIRDAVSGALDGLTAADLAKAEDESIETDDNTDSIQDERDT